MVAPGDLLVSCYVYEVDRIEILGSTSASEVGE